MIFDKALNDVTQWAKDHGIDIVYTDDLDPFFKGDLDGQTIRLGTELNGEDKLFNACHLIGHCIQWATDEKSYELGRLLHVFPDEELEYNLIHYEWQANCYGYQILRECGYFMMSWYGGMFQKDMRRLVYYYRTGSTEGTDTEVTLPVIMPQKSPSFIPKKRHTSRNGIVI